MLQAQEFDFYARGPYRPQVPRPEALLGYRIGSQQTMYHQQQAVLDRMMEAVKNAQPEQFPKLSSPTSHDLPPGRYAVAFRLKAEGRGDSPVARLDVFNFWLSQEGKDGTCAQRMLRSTALKSPGHYADYWLDFEHRGAGKVEYRVFWPGDAPLSVDRVVIFRKP